MAIESELNRFMRSAAWGSAWRLISDPRTSFDTSSRFEGAGVLLRPRARAPILQLSIESQTLLLHNEVFFQQATVSTGEFGH